MLPIYTTGQVQNGITPGGDLMLDLSDYMKKKDAEKLATTEALEALSNIVSGKLDSSPQHKHHIEDVKQLEEALKSKYDKSEKYSHNVILNDIEKISYLEAPKIELMEIVKDKDGSGYKFYVDDSNGDLMITLDDVLIGSYFKATGKWNFNGMDSQTELAEITKDITILKKDLSDCNNTIMNSYNDSMMQIVMLNQANIKTQNNLDTHITEANTKITAVQNEINNHTHETINNNLTVNGELSTTKCTVDDGIVFDNPTVSSDMARIRLSGAYNEGVLEIATGDDCSEPIVVRQYSYAGNAPEPRFGTLGRELKLLDTNGNTEIPGNLTVKGTNILSKITELENILKNHYDALLILCQKHGMVDSNTSDGSNVTPK